MYYSYFIVHLVGTFELHNLLKQLACLSCNRKEIKCIKAADIHDVTGGVIKYIILCNHCGYNFPWCSSLLSDKGAALYTRQLAIEFISNGLNYTAYINVLSIPGMHQMSSLTFDHVKK
jgi:hypothetical protein